MVEKRFTLRNEYFGGIVHDSKEMRVDILTDEQFGLLKHLDTEQGRVNAESVTKTDLNFGKIVTGLQARGALDSLLVPENVRLVEHPLDPLPQGTLASPLRVYDTFGFGCNMFCENCLNESEREKLNIGRRSLRDTEHIMGKFKDAGTMEWRFTGGEPTVHPELLDSLAIAKGLGMATMLNTNGWWKKEMYDPLLNAGLSEIIISLEGRKEVNDKLRMEGGHEHVMETIIAILEHNYNHPDKAIKMTLNQTVGGKNYQEVEYVVRLGASVGASVNFVPLRPYGRAHNANTLDTKGFMEFSREVQRLREDPAILKSGIKIIHKNMDLFNDALPDRSDLPFPFNYSACGALSTGFGLSPNGRANACSFLAYDDAFKGKNLCDPAVSVYDAWLEKKFDDIRKAEKIGCTKCDYYMVQCEGKCTAMVLANGGRFDIRDDRNVLIGHDIYCFRGDMKRETAKLGLHK